GAGHDDLAHCGDRGEEQGEPQALGELRGELDAAFDGAEGAVAAAGEADGAAGVLAWFLWGVGFSAGVLPGTGGCAHRSASSGVRRPRGAVFGVGAAGPGSSGTGSSSRSEAARS